MPATAMFCCRCKKDVSTQKRVKDPRGNIYCEPCYKAAVQQQQQMQQQQAGASRCRRPCTASSPPPPPPPSANLPLRRPPPPDRHLRQRKNRFPISAPPATRPSSPTAASVSNATATSPRWTSSSPCALSTPRSPPRKNSATPSAKPSRPSSSSSSSGAPSSSWGYGAWIMLHPGKPFDDYPTTRADAVKQILANISSEAHRRLAL